MTFVLFYLSFIYSIYGLSFWGFNTSLLFWNLKLQCSFFHTAMPSVKWANLSPNPEYTGEKARRGSNGRQQSPFLLPCAVKHVDTLPLSLLILVWALPLQIHKTKMVVWSLWCSPWSWTTSLVSALGEGVSLGNSGWGREMMWPQRIPPPPDYPYLS